ncbi:hypothetical protein KKC06_03285, partial [Patescibacteria group bacterium]|nr:hypothetical protein [Patescibacteria group bacterium]
MNKKSYWIVGIIAVFTLVLAVSAPSAKAVTATASLSNVSTTKTGAGATNATWTATMTVNSALPANTDLSFALWGNTPPGEGFNFTNATVAIAGVAGTSESMNPDRINFRLNSTLSTGSKTVTITGVTNSSMSGLYYFGVEIRTPGSEGPGE